MARRNSALVMLAKETFAARMEIAGNAQARVEQCEDLMERHKSQNFTAQDLADLCGVSVSQLYRDWRKCRGYTPWMTTWMRRMDQARHYLMSDERATASDASHKFGIWHYRFVDDYERLYGETPNQTISKRKRLEKQRQNAIESKGRSLVAAE